MEGQSLCSAFFPWRRRRAEIPMRQPPPAAGRTSTGGLGPLIFPVGRMGFSAPYGNRGFPVCADYGPRKGTPARWERVAALCRGAGRGRSGWSGSLPGCGGGWQRRTGGRISSGSRGSARRPPRRAALGKGWVRLQVGALDLAPGSPAGFWRLGCQEAAGPVRLPSRPLTVFLGFGVPKGREAALRPGEGGGRRDGPLLQGWGPGAAPRRRRPGPAGSRGSSGPGSHRRWTPGGPCSRRRFGRGPPRGRSPAP